MSDDAKLKEAKREVRDIMATLDEAIDALLEATNAEDWTGFSGAVSDATDAVDNAAMFLDGLERGP